MKKQTSYAIGGVVILVLILFLALFIDIILPPPDSSAATPLGEETKRSLSSSTTPTQSSNGDVVLIEEFSDFQCPFCAEALPILKRIKGKYGDKIDIQLRHFPIEKIHPMAPMASLASECMRDQEKFWAYHDRLFENQARLSSKTIKEIALELGADESEFDLCMASKKHAGILQRDFLEGRERGVQGTPTFFINEARYEGILSYERFVEIIDSEIDRTPTTTEPVEAAP